MSIHQLSEAQVKLVKTADKVKTGDWYRYYTRNEDKSIRKKFKDEIPIKGTHPWAIRMAAMVMRGLPDCRPSDHDCETAIVVLTENGARR